MSNPRNTQLFELSRVGLRASVLRERLVVISYLLVAAVFLLYSCANPHGDQTPDVNVKPGETELLTTRSNEKNSGTRVRLKGQELLVEIADETSERAQGLSGRDQLAPGTGMLFLYSQPRILEFWMKDCFLDLDIAFIDSSRRVIRLGSLQSPENAGEVLSLSSLTPAAAVLEVPFGWFASHGVSPGDLIDLDVVLEDIWRRADP